MEKIPYIKDLGVTAVELMPVFAFDEQDAPEDNKKPKVQKRSTKKMLT
ncbi:hypothetical protein ACQ1Q1_11645 [Ornithobacterium rhinotracheale]